jgi:hypothetical protein
MVTSGLYRIKMACLFVQFTSLCGILSILHISRLFWVIMLVVAVWILVALLLMEFKITAPFKRSEG